MATATLKRLYDLAVADTTRNIHRLREELNLALEDRRLLLDHRRLIDHSASVSTANHAPLRRKKL